MELTRIAICQKDAVPGDKEKNLEEMARVVEGTDADLYVFPECFVTGYMIRDDVHDLAEPLDGPAANFMSSLARDRGVCVVAGMPERSPEIRGLIHNSAFVAYPNGNVYSYRKIYLPNFGPFEEKLYYTGGQELPLFTLGGLRFGISICYDLFFPEIAKHYALQGADLFLNLAASPTMSRRSFEAVLPARAVENTVFMAFSNNVGLQDNMEFWGGSMVMGPKGNVLGSAGVLERTVLVTEMCMEDIMVARRYRPTIRDTRPSMLRALQGLRPDPRSR